MIQNWYPASYNAEGWQLFSPTTSFGKGSGNCTREEPGPQQCQKGYFEQHCERKVVTIEVEGESQICFTPDTRVDIAGLF